MKIFPETKSRKTSPTHAARGRVLVIKVLFLLCFAVVAVRLVQLQVIDAGMYSEAARRQYEDRVVIRAMRGSVYDRMGRILISSAMDISFAVDPKVPGFDANKLARRFANTFHKSTEHYLTKIGPRNTNFVWLERHVARHYGTVLKASDLPGLIVVDEPRRVYHEGHLAAQLLGFTDVDGRGISGVELQFDDLLRGKDGYVIMHRDGLGRARHAVDYPRVEAQHGKSIILTINKDYQAICEEELHKGIQEYDAEGGLAVMLDPRTGEVLAMVTYPPIDPARAGDYDQSLTRNRVVTDMFEPGSVFKVVTVSAALDHALVMPEQKFFAEQGTYQIALGRGEFRTIRDFHPYGILTFQEAMEVSSNIVMAKVSDLIGAERMYRTARNFGFGTETGVQLPGEISGELKRPTQWWGTTLNSIAYGYEVGVTPLQIAAAYAAVANGGVLHKPSIFHGIFGDGQQEALRPQTIRRVTTPETAGKVQEFLIGVVERGTGTSARIPGMIIAGKTGTSRKVVNGKYVPGIYTATFAGFFPAENPKAVCVVMLDTRSTIYTGGLASAPIFKRIAEKITALSEQFSGPPVADANGHTLPALPDVVNMKVEDAVSLLQTAGFNAEPNGGGAFVLDQSPRPGSKVRSDEEIRLEAGEPTSQPDLKQVRVPDLLNLSLRRAMNRLTMCKLQMIVEGSGRVASQHPSAGQLVNVGSSVSVECRQGTALNGSL
jgi:cell division protein FtsI (penicillin-binding protein 3)